MQHLRRALSPGGRLLIIVFMATVLY